MPPVVVKLQILSGRTRAFIVAARPSSRAQRSRFVMVASPVGWSAYPLTDGERPPQMRRKPDGIAESAEREPSESENPAFARLFEDAYRRCFSTAFTAPLTESESHRFSVEIAESTGLEIGWKSLKNYSHFLLGRTNRVENPSIATLDTLARYVAGAPPTDEERRRTSERHYPYWVRTRRGSDTRSRSRRSKGRTRCVRAPM